VSGFKRLRALHRDVAKPLRFRVSESDWSEHRVRSALHGPLNDAIGAELNDSWFDPPAGYDARRLDMDNGDVALFAWTDGRAYWMGNTETPQTLWRTEKEGFEEVPYPVARWAQRELLAQLHDESPWLAEYPHVSWFFLPVFLSKDGRETTREFFDAHAAGFPDATREDALAHVEGILKLGMLDEHRHVMAGKLGTSEYLDETRMAAAIAEFTAAGLLDSAGWAVTPEIEVSTGHSLDYRVDKGGESRLVEVTRPSPPSERRAGTPVQAVRETANTKTAGQLREHAGGATLFVDCSGFPDDAWASVLAEKPSVGHRPAVVYRARPNGRVEGYRFGGNEFGFEWL